MGMDELGAIRFINSIPEGFWTAYSDVAAVCGSKSPRSIGVWLRRSTGRINHYWRVLNVDGEVPDEFVGGGSGPITPENARDKLRREGVWVDASGRARQRQRFTAADYAAFLRDGTIRESRRRGPVPPGESRPSSRGPGSCASAARRAFARSRRVRRQLGRL
jgi:alkylated DNA nucleotide flippase Atl1